MTQLYCARWVLPILSAPIEDGAVAIEGSRIVSVGSRRELSGKFAEARVSEFGEAAILPGLVNCHSHLELTAMRGFLEPVESNFLAWLKKLTVARQDRMTQDDLYVSAAWGAVEAARAGVTCLGDAGDSGDARLMALRDVGLRGVVYQEVFGPDSKLAQDRFAQLQEKVSALQEEETELVRVGVSPHAPYTVSKTLLELITDFALSNNLPVMIHAAESEAEELFMREGTGPFALRFAQGGIDWRAPRVSTIQYFKEVGLLRARPLLAHCIRVDATDIETIREADASIAHCPKSNAKLGHGRAPLAAFLNQGLRVGLGSDSVASNNTCDMLEEARYAALISRASVDKIEGDEPLGAEQMLRAATRAGAQSFWPMKNIGSLAEGMDADLCIIRLDGAHQLPVYDPHSALIFASSHSDVILTMVAGREIFRDGRVTTVDEERLRARIREIGRGIMKRDEG
ncbi:MAG: amidohydrolase family protein [Pyrinomonadaceae bacterium]